MILASYCEGRFVRTCMDNGDLGYLALGLIMGAVYALLIAIGDRRARVRAVASLAFVVCFLVVVSVRYG